MRILLLAPHPFYQERGTPIAVSLLVRALADAGHAVDMLAYHEGTDIALPPGVSLQRIRRPPLARNIRPGFSVKKLICDAVMFPHALRLARERRYDLVHAVEESVYMAMAIRARRGIPYVYDMDSSLAQQVVEKRPLLAPLSPLLRACERRAMRGALAVVPVCDALADLARPHARRLVVLRDVPLADAAPTAEERAALPDLGGGAGDVRFMYVGNLERYQGIDLLLASFAALRAGGAARAVLTVVGGAEADVRRYRARAEALGLGGAAHFTGPLPLRLQPALFEQADVLVSPRRRGINTPMKVYSYLQSGKPVLATAIRSHTQVMDDGAAMLTAPEPAAFAQAMRRLADDPALRARLGAAGRALVERAYSLERFRETVGQLYADLAADLTAKPA